MNTLDHVWQSTINTVTALDVLEDISPYDVLNHFNKHIFPKIKEKYFPTPIKVVTTTVKRNFLDVFRKKNISSFDGDIKPVTKKNDMDEKNLYELYWAEIAKWIFELVVGKYTNDIKRINLFLEVMYTEMTTTAYANSWLDFNNCAKMFETEWVKDKSRIIQESLKLCDKRFRKWFTTIQFTDDHLIFKNGYGTTIQTKGDFFNKD